MLGDTIVARASAAGSSERAVVRVSGPRAFVVAGVVWVGALPQRRGCFVGRVRVRGREVDAMVLVFEAPRSFTGENVVELHVPGGALLVESLLAELLADGAARGVRAALPGEFTARAVQHGTLPAAAVEGLLLLLHAQDRGAAAAATAWLHGGACEELAVLRARVQDVLALLEAGLDFGDGETGAVPEADWRAPLVDVHDRLAALAATLPAAAAGGELLLLGAANVGKSSLANALAGRAAALVDPTAGTTRDVLRIEVPGGGVLWDAPGDFAGAGDADVDALASRDRLGAAAAGHVLVLDVEAPHVPPAALAATTPCAAIVWTKCDRVAAPPPLAAVLPRELAERAAAVPVFATSAVAGTGLDALRAWLAQHAHGEVVDAGGPLRRALTAAVAAIGHALAAGAGASPELAAVDLQQALRALDDVPGVGGPHSAEALLDRIYRSFCLGK